MSKPLRCRLGIHSAQLSQGEVGYCQREGCDYKLEHANNGRTWTRMIPENVDFDITKHVGGLPPPPLPPAQRVEIHVYHHGQR